MNIPQVLESRWSHRMQSAAVSILFGCFVFLDARRFALTHFPFFAFRAAFMASIAILYVHRTIFPSAVRSTLLGRCVALVHALFPVFISFNVNGKVGILAVIGIVSGMAISALALVDLWESFGLAPANRGVKTDGMYRFVRHPMYLGYLISVWSVGMSQASIWNVVICIVFLALTLWRIELEEEVLRQDETFKNYQKRVRYRLLPFIL
jgi:protein-S-isoprenylcysteine O-methyltransferase Ste14